MDVDGSVIFSNKCNFCLCHTQPMAPMRCKRVGAVRGLGILSITPSSYKETEAQRRNTALVIT